MNRKRIAHVALSTFLAGTLTFGAGATNVFADATPAPTATAAPTSTPQQATGAAAENQSTAQTYVLVPGDFFYFVKSHMEQIKLALTTDNVIKAHLLAEFAQERIKEANILSAKGKTELSVQSLQNAIDVQESAIDSIDQTTTNEVPSQQSETPAPETTEAPTPTETPAPAETPSPTPTPAPETVQSTTHLPSSTVTEELADQLQQNIDALVTALEKVDNEADKKVLVHGVERVFDKFSKSTKQLVHVDSHFETKVALIDAKFKSGLISGVEAEQEKNKLQTQADQKADKIAEQLEHKLSIIQKQVQKKVNQSEEKQNKEASKNAKEAAKEQSKKAKESAKEKFKHAKGKNQNNDDDDDDQQ